MSDFEGLNLERQSGIIPTSVIQNIKVTIIGVGAIGSHVAKQLSQIGIRDLKVYDFDTIEEHNLPNQGFGLPDLGKPKVLAVKDRLELDYGVKVEARAEKVDADTKFDTEIVISAVDSMAARKAIWDSVKASSDVSVFLDARMGAMYAEAYSVSLESEDSIKGYEDTLFDDSEGYRAPCTEKSTIFCAAGTSAVLSSMVAAYAMKTLKPKKVEIDWARFLMS